MKVPWVSKEKIASRAMDLMEAFQAVAGYRVKPPIPVEDIIERSLGLRLLYEDLEKMFGSNDVLGATGSITSLLKLILVETGIWDDIPQPSFPRTYNVIPANAGIQQ